MQRQPRCFMDIRKHQHRTASLFSLVQRTTTIISMSVTTRMELSSIIVCMCACVCVCVLLIYHLPEEKRNPFLRHNAQRRVCSQPRNDAHRLYIGAKRIIEKKICISCFGSLLSHVTACLFLITLTCGVLFLCQSERAFTTLVEKLPPFPLRTA